MSRSTASSGQTASALSLMLSKPYEDPLVRLECERMKLKSKVRVLRARVGLEEDRWRRRCEKVAQEAHDRYAKAVWKWRKRCEEARIARDRWKDRKIYWERKARRKQPPEVVVEGTRAREDFAAILRDLVDGGDTLPQIKQRAKIMLERHGSGKDAK